MKKTRGGGSKSKYQNTFRVKVGKRVKRSLLNVAQDQKNVGYLNPKSQKEGKGKLWGEGAARVPMRKHCTRGKKGNTANSLTGQGKGENAL